MRRRTTLIWFLGSVVSLVSIVTVASHMYWSAFPPPAGEYILFRRVVPEPLGRVIWLTIRPGLLLAFVLTVWSLWKLLRAWRAKPPAGICTVCGYDLRATPDRCPECGTAPKERRTQRYSAE